MNREAKYLSVGRELRGQATFAGSYRRHLDLSCRLFDEVLKSFTDNDLANAFNGFAPEARLPYTCEIEVFAVLAHLLYWELGGSCALLEVWDRQSIR